MDPGTEQSYLLMQTHSAYTLGRKSEIAWSQPATRGLNDVHAQSRSETYIDEGIRWQEECLTANRGSPYAAICNMGI